MGVAVLGRIMSSDPFYDEAFGGCTDSRSLTFSLVQLVTAVALLACYVPPSGDKGRSQRR